MQLELELFYFCQVQQVIDEREYHAHLLVDLLQGRSRLFQALLQLVNYLHNLVALLHILLMRLRPLLARFGQVQGINLLTVTGTHRTQVSKLGVIKSRIRV